MVTWVESTQKCFASPHVQNDPFNTLSAFVNELRAQITECGGVRVVLGIICARIIEKSHLSVISIRDVCFRLMCGTKQVSFSATVHFQSYRSITATNLLRACARCCTVEAPIELSMIIDVLMPAFSIQGVFHHRYSNPTYAWSRLHFQSIELIIRDIEDEHVLKFCATLSPSE